MGSDLPPSAQHLQRLLPDWPESDLERLRFYTTLELEGLVELVETVQAPSVTVLSGSLGHSDLCRSTQQRLETEDVVLWSFDLEGFEPEHEHPLKAYRDQLMARRGGAGPATQQLAELALEGPAGDWAAALLSVLWSFEDSTGRYTEILSRAAAERDDPQTLRACLAELTQGQHLMVHVADSELLTLALRRWLIDASERAGAPLLLSCDAKVTTEHVVPSSEYGPLRIEVEPVPAMEALSRDLSARVESCLEDHGGEHQDKLRELLLLAALGGRYVPLRPLFDFLKLTEDEREDFTDFVDDYLEEELGWLEDCGFQHPSFPGLNVYAFTHPLLVQVILDQVPELEREMQAISYLRFLEQHVRPGTRGVARWLLALATHLGERERAVYEQHLAWWVGPDAAETLRNEVSQALAVGRIPPDKVWHIARDAGVWPAHRRMALLDALSEAESAGEIEENWVSADSQAEFHLLRASLAIELGRFEEGQKEAALALPLIDDSTMGRAQALTLAGLAGSELGRHELAEEAFQEVADLTAELLGAEHPFALNARGNLAKTLQELGKDDEAQRLLDEVMAASRQLLDLDEIVEDDDDELD